MVNHSSEEARMQDSIAAFVAREDKKAQQKMVDGYNLLRGALAWFDSHSVEEKLGHLPQWVVMARELTKNG